MTFSANDDRVRVLPPALVAPHTTPRLIGRFSPANELQKSNHHLRARVHPQTLADKE
jgi:hypothetical protein